MDGLQFSKNGIEFEVHNFEFNFDDDNNLMARHKDTGRELVFGKDGTLKSDQQIHSTVVDEEIEIGPDEGSVIAGPVSGEGGFTGEGNLRIVDADDKPLQAFRRNVDGRGFRLDDADLQNSSDTVDHDETTNRTHDGDDISPNLVDANEVETEDLVVGSEAEIPNTYRPIAGGVDDDSTSPIDITIEDPGLDSLNESDVIFRLTISPRQSDDFPPLLLRFEGDDSTRYRYKSIDDGVRTTSDDDKFTLLDPLHSGGNVRGGAVYEFVARTRTNIWGSGANGSETGEVLFNGEYTGGDDIWPIEIFSESGEAVCDVLLELKEREFQE